MVRDGLSCIGSDLDLRSGRVLDGFVCIDFTAKQNCLEAAVGCLDASEALGRDLSL